MSPIDRYAWGEGPWDNEPDELDWVDEATGLPCSINRNAMGTLCGYVAVPSTHPDYGKGYDDVDVEVHGGLTYASPRDDGLWWFGFDCGHYMDYAPSFAAAFRHMGRPNMNEYERTCIYRTVEYVQEECRKLALQFAEAGSK